MFRSVDSYLNIKEKWGTYSIYLDSYMVSLRKHIRMRRLIRTIQLYLDTLAGSQTNEQYLRQLHYEITPIQIYRKIQLQKLKIFR